MEKVKPYFKYIVLAALLYVPVFSHLDRLAIRVWDESRLALNAYEMYQDGNVIVTHFEGEPDMWNTKPPMMIWLQVLCMKFLGVNELAVRLPSAFAAFFTCLALLIFFTRYLKNFWFAFIAILVLITSDGYINQHAARTGDYDALLALFTTVSGLLFFTFCETKNYKYLYGVFLFTTFAVLTKSVSGLLFVPAFAIYSIIQKQFIPLLKSKHFYIGAGSFLVVVLAYYFLREANNHGYLAAVQENELGGRFSETIEGHKFPFGFYLQNFIDSRLADWYLLVPCGVIVGFLIKDEKIKKIAMFSSLMALTFFLIISTAQTKIDWYDVPLYPFLAIIIATFIYYIFQLFENATWANQTLAVNVAPYIFLFFIFITPYKKIIDKTFIPQEIWWERDFYEMSYYLRDAAKGKYNLDKQTYIYDEYNAHQLFYIKQLKDKGIYVSVKDWTEDLKNYKFVFTNKERVKQHIETNYSYQITDTLGHITTYKILGKK